MHCGYVLHMMLRSVVPSYVFHFHKIFRFIGGLGGS
jgi:hypothetical protein